MPKLSMLRARAISKSLAGTAIFLLIPARTLADDFMNFSLSPNPPRECETLTIQWDDTESLLCVQIFGRQTLSMGIGRISTLFHTVVSAPTQSAEWLVSATSGDPVFVQVFGEGPSWDSPFEGGGTQLQVLPGASACLPPVRRSRVLFFHLRHS